MSHRFWWCVIDDALACEVNKRLSDEAASLAADVSKSENDLWSSNRLWSLHILFFSPTKSIASLFCENESFCWSIEFRDLHDLRSNQSAEGTEISKHNFAFFVNSIASSLSLCFLIACYMMNAADHFSQFLKTNKTKMEFDKTFRSNFPLCLVNSFASLVSRWVWESGRRIASRNRRVLCSGEKCKWRNASWSSHATCKPKLRSTTMEKWSRNDFKGNTTQQLPIIVQY